MRKMNNTFIIVSMTEIYWDNQMKYQGLNVLTSMLDVLDYSSKCARVNIKVSISKLDVMCLWNINDRIMQSKSLKLKCQLTFSLNIQITKIISKSFGPQVSTISGSSCYLSQLVEKCILAHKSATTTHLTKQVKLKEMGQLMTKVQIYNC